MKRYYVVVSGLVQQVGFRFFVCQEALKLNLTGWVRNCDDGTVEVEVQGEEEIIAKFVEKLKAGNRFSRVEEVSSKIIDIKKNEKSFKYLN